MNNTTIIHFGFLVLVSITLVGCGSGSNTPSDSSPQNDQEIVEQQPTKPSQEGTGSTDAQQDSGQQPQADAKTQTITASEILYAAKVGDSIEEHPAWLTVSVTLENDTITGLNIDQKHSSPKSARHQAQFASKIESKVIGKKLSESNSVYISSASSTSWAFNDAIEDIQELYEQSQS